MESFTLLHSVSRGTECVTIYDLPVVAWDMGFYYPFLVESDTADRRAVAVALGWTGTVVACCFHVELGQLAD